jgi:hypothetical protein
VFCFSKKQLFVTKKKEGEGGGCVFGFFAKFDKMVKFFGTLCQVFDNK